MFMSYYELTKPKVVKLILVTAIIGMLLAVDYQQFPVQEFIFGLIGIGLGSASGAAFNHIIDEGIDSKMQRTENRPLPTGSVTKKNAIIFASSLGILSMLVLTLFVNFLTAWLTLVSMIGYAVIYTIYLKRSTPQNIVWGGAAGAMPPVLGWTAVTGSVHTEALLLFLLVFIWTPPHFWALAIKRREEYKKADIPMLPVTHGVDFTKDQILLYTLMLLVVSVLPFAIQMSGVIYLAAAVVLGFIFIYFAWKLHRDPSDKNAMKTFWYSIFYLNGIFLFLLLDRYARIFLDNFY
jgi:protoheme IX farnesyltransferase